MDDAEMTREARKLVARFAKHVPEDELEPIYRSARSGDRTAIPALAGILVRDRVAISHETRKALVKFLQAIGAPVNGVQELPEAKAGERMDSGELARLSHAVVTRLAPKLEPLQAKIIRESDEAGAWEVALPELTAVLVDQRIVVTETDRDDLRRLLERLGEPTNDVHQLNVVAEGD